MAQSGYEEHEMGKHEPVLSQNELGTDEGVVVVKFSIESQSDRTEEILGIFSWSQWNEAGRCFDDAMAEIVGDVIPGALYSNYEELSELYSEALTIMVDNKDIPFTYVMLLRRKWLEEKHG